MRGAATTRCGDYLSLLLSAVARERQVNPQQQLLLARAISTGFSGGTGSGGSNNEDDPLGRKVPTFMSTMRPSRADAEPSSPSISSQEVSTSRRISGVISSRVLAAPSYLATPILADNLPLGYNVQAADAMSDVPLSYYRMKYHKIPVYSLDADESWQARRKLFLRFAGFVAASYVAGVLSLKALTLGSIYVAESLGYANSAHGELVKQRVTQQFEVVLSAVVAEAGSR